MNLLSVIKSFKTGDYRVSRRLQVALVQGKAQNPVTTYFFIEACVQPVTGRQIERLPEGLRSFEVKAIFCKEELFLNTNTRLADLIEIKGVLFEVSDVKPFDDLGNYFEILVVKVS